MYLILYFFYGLLPTNDAVATLHICNVFLSTEDGEIYVCGWNKNGQLGFSSQLVDYPTFCQVPSLPHKIAKVSCGWNHTMALTENGTVYVWGSNAFGQLGVPEVQKQSESPIQLSTEVCLCSIH